MLRADIRHRELADDNALLRQELSRAHELLRSVSSKAQDTGRALHQCHEENAELRRRSQHWETVAAQSREEVSLLAQKIGGGAGSHGTWSAAALANPPQGPANGAEAGAWHGAPGASVSVHPGGLGRSLGFPGALRFPADTPVSRGLPAMAAPVQSLGMHGSAPSSGMGLGLGLGLGLGVGSAPGSGVGAPMAPGPTVFPSPIRPRRARGKPPMEPDFPGLVVQGKNGQWYECKNNDWKPLAAEVLQQHLASRRPFDMRFQTADRSTTFTAQVLKLH